MRGKCFPNAHVGSLFLRTFLVVALQLYLKMCSKVLKDLWWRTQGGGDGAGRKTHFPFSGSDWFWIANLWVPGEVFGERAMLRWDWGIPFLDSEISGDLGVMGSQWDMMPESLPSTTAIFFRVSNLYYLEISWNRVLKQFWPILFTRDDACTRQMDSTLNRMFIIWLKVKKTAGKEESHFHLQVFENSRSR